MLSRPLRRLRKLQTSLRSAPLYIRLFVDVSIKLQGRSVEFEKVCPRPKRWMHLCEDMEGCGAIKVCIYGWREIRVIFLLRLFSLRLLIRPSFLLTLHMNVGKAPGEGWGFTATLLLAFVFSDPLYLYLRAWQLSRERVWHLSCLQSSCAAHTTMPSLRRIVFGIIPSLI